MLQVRTGTKWRIGDVLVMVIFGIKITVFACLLSDEESNSFPKHLDLALAPNKTNEGVEKQWNIRQHDKLRRTVTY